MTMSLHIERGWVPATHTMLDRKLINPHREGMDKNFITYLYNTLLIS